MNSDVTLQATSLLEVQSSVSFQHNVNVTLQSGGGLTVDATKGLTLNSAATLILQAGYNSANFKVEVGTGSLMLDGATLSAGVMTLQAAGGIGLGSAHISAGSLLDIGTAGTVAGAGGDVTQAAGGVLNAGSLLSSLGIAGTLTLVGSNSITTLGGVVASSGVTLGAGNTIPTIGNVTATAGDIVLADAAPLVTLAGALKGNNLFIEAASAGGTLSLGSPAVAGPPAIPAAPASLTLNGTGRISLVADHVTEVAGSTLNSPATVEIAPFSSIAETLNVASSTGTFGVDSTLLGEIGSANTLVVGRVTPQAGLGTMTADGVSIAGAVNLDRHRRGARSRQQQRREPGRRRHAHRRHAAKQRRRHRHGQPRRHQERDRHARDVRRHRRRSVPSSTPAR